MSPLLILDSCSRGMPFCSELAIQPKNWKKYWEKVAKHIPEVEEVKSAFYRLVLDRINSLVSDKTKIDYRLNECSDPCLRIGGKEIKTLQDFKDETPRSKLLLLLR